MEVSEGDGCEIVGGCSSLCLRAQCLPGWPGFMSQGAACGLAGLTSQVSVNRNERDCVWCTVNPPPPSTSRRASIFLSGAVHGVVWREQSSIKSIGMG